MVFLLAFLFMAVLMAGMAIGAIAGRGPLKGSCGGLAAAGIEGRCEICGDDPSLCEEQEGTPPATETSRFYNASN